MSHLIISPYTSKFVEPPLAPLRPIGASTKKFSYSLCEWEFRRHLAFRVHHHQMSHSFSSGCNVVGNIGDSWLFGLLVWCNFKPKKKGLKLRMYDSVMICSINSM
ncbi:hypothetical protein ACJW30_10G147800 [Castanea mollissima]